jgi:hypothetical protein
MLENFAEITIIQPEPGKRVSNNDILRAKSVICIYKIKKLDQNCPNPFNPSTIISYSLPANNSFVSLKVYDVIGREVATLVNKNVVAGEHQITFNAANLSSGIYLYQIRAGNFVQTKKMILLK